MSWTTKTEQNFHNDVYETLICECFHHQLVSRPLRPCSFQCGKTLNIKPFKHIIRYDLHGYYCFIRSFYMIKITYQNPNRRPLVQVWSLNERPEANVNSMFLSNYNIINTFVNIRSPQQKYMLCSWCPTKIWHNIAKYCIKWNNGIWRSFISS